MINITTERRSQMNIYKKLTAVFLALLMFLSIAPAQCFAAAETENTEITSETSEPPDEENVGEEAADENLITVDGIKYQLTSEEAFIVGAEDLSGIIELPSEIEGLPVTRICEKAFAFSREITAVVIPDTVKSIEEDAFFGCSKLSDVKISADNVDISQGVFSNTSCYSSQYKQGELLYIDGYLIEAPLYSSPVTEVTVSPQTRGIADKAFSGYYTTLRKVKIPDRDCHIYDGAQTFRDSLKIYGRTGSTAEAYAEKYSRTFLAYCAHTEKKEYAETETTCTAIGYTAGVRCEECGEWFSGHEIKTEVHHRDENSDGICDDCENKVTAIINSGKCGDAAYFVFYDNRTLIIEGKGALDKYINWGTQKIQKLIIGEGITRISDDAFANEVTAVQLPSTLISIGKRSFYSSYIKELTLPDSVVSIGESAFRESRLRSLHIGKGLQSIGDGAFLYTILQSVTVSPENSCFSGDENGVLFNKDRSVLLYYPSNKTDEEYTVPTCVRKIAKDAFRNSRVKKVVLPGGIEEIDTSAFEYNQNLIEINLPESLDIIANHAFYMCRSMTKVILPESLSVLGDYAFAYVGSATGGGIGSLTVPGGIKVIGDYAFKNCDGINYLTIEDGVKEIGNGAFYGTDMKKVEIPSSVISMGSEVFSQSHSLQEIVFTDGFKEIPSNVLRGCISLTRVTLPDSITKIGEKAFYDCRGLLEIRFPENLVSIGDYAFEACNKLTALNFNDKLKAIGTGAFYGCEKITSLECNRELVSIGISAFKNCKALETVRFNDSLETIGASAFVGTALKGSLVFPESLRAIGSNAFFKLENIESLTFNEGADRNRRAVLFHAEKN